MNERMTEFFASLGALLGITNVAWNIWSWHQNRRPRLVVEVEVRELADSSEIFYAVRNRGGQSTTIEELQLVKYRFGPFGGFGLLEHVEYVATRNPDSVKLPAVVSPGEVWTGSSPVSEETRRSMFDDWASEKLSLIKKGRLFFKIRCSHFDGLLYGKVRMERLLPFG
jgi:hypothetical protein